MDSFSGNLAINLDLSDHYTEQELELFGGLLMGPNIFVRTGQSRENKKK